MIKRNKEFLYSLLAVLVITAVYGFIAYWFHAIPAASGLFGHLLGIIGFLLMLLTETSLFIPQTQSVCALGQHGLLAPIPYLHRSGRSIYGALAQFLEI